MVFNFGDIRMTTKEEPTRDEFIFISAQFETALSVDIQDFSRSGDFFIVTHTG